MRYLVILLAVIVMMAAPPAKAELTGDGPRPDPYIQEDPVMGTPDEYQENPAIYAPQAQPTPITTNSVPDPMQVPPTSVTSTYRQQERAAAAEIRQIGTRSADRVVVRHTTVYVDNPLTEKRLRQNVRRVTDVQDAVRSDRKTTQVVVKAVNRHESDISEIRRAVRAIDQENRRQASTLRWHTGGLLALLGALILMGFAIWLTRQKHTINLGGTP